MGLSYKYLFVESDCFRYSTKTTTHIAGSYYEVLHFKVCLTILGYYVPKSQKVYVGSGNDISRFSTKTLTDYYTEHGITNWHNVNKRVYSCQNVILGYK